MFEVKVTVTLAPEVLNLLSGLITGQLTGVNTKKEGTNKNNVVDYPQKESQTESSVDTGGVTLETLKELAKKMLQSDEGRAALKSILSGVGARKVTEVKEKDYVQMHGKLKEAQGA